jgi:hypothetical protein
MDVTILPIIGTVAVGAMVGALITFIVKWRRFGRWKNAKGTVVELNPKDASEGGSSWEARIEFTTHTGDIVRFNNRVTTNPPIAPVGETVPIIYDPDDPKDAIVHRFFYCHLMECLVFAMGVVAFLVFVFETTKH